MSKKKEKNFKKEQNDSQEEKAQKKEKNNEIEIAENSRREEQKEEITKGQLTFDQIDNSENIYSQSKEEEIRTEINTTIRLGFIRKVYGILCLQLFMKRLFSLFAMISKSLKEFMLLHVGLLYLMLSLVLILPIVIVCCEGIMRQVPQNYIILFLFTLAESYINLI